MNIRILVVVYGTATLNTTTKPPTVLSLKLNEPLLIEYHGTEYTLHTIPLTLNTGNIH